VEEVTSCEACELSISCSFIYNLSVKLGPKKAKKVENFGERVGYMKICKYCTISITFQIVVQVSYESSESSVRGV
jgi:hypothetical protein